MTSFIHIQDELEVFETFIYNRIKGYFDENSEKINFVLTEKNTVSRYSDFIKSYDLSEDEYLVLILALSREVSPEILDPFLSKNTLYDLPYTEFGGIKIENRRGFIPTIQTALFLLSATKVTNSLEKRIIFSEHSNLFKNNILEKPSEDDFLSSELKLSKATLHDILGIEEKAYDFSKEFPAKKLESSYDWNDLIVSEYTKDHLEELNLWLSHSDILLEEWSMSKSLKKGYKALFYGPPGTGKSMTAALLGKKLNKDVYRIDLSQVVSKYIGETEKNLEKVFQKAEEKDWILFFDEADSLFGKRTQVNSSNDKHANQETSYLLQRIDDCNNMIILASNLKDNFDPAYLRRFQSIVYFPLPDAKERLILWKKGFSDKADFSQIDLESISDEYEVSGATIMNVIRFSSLMAIKRKNNIIIHEDIIKGIRREKYKEGKLV